MENSSGIKIWTVIDIIKWGTDYLSSKGIESPRLNCELMICHALKTDRLGIYTHFEKPLTKSELELLRNCFSRRAAREPLQYITGTVNFMGIELMVNKNVLIPRPETEELVSLCLKNIEPVSKCRVLDIGSGSGCIAIAIASALPDAEVISIDIDENALSVAEKNKSLNNLNNIQFKRMDILSAERPSIGSFDIIISNPPYISNADYGQLEPELKNYEPKISLTDFSDGLTFYRLYASIYKSLLNENGKFFLELGYGQADDVRMLFENMGYQIEIFKDMSGIERFVQGKID
jgi:release factor glutamine methyltransferase